MNTLNVQLQIALSEAARVALLAGVRLLLFVNLCYVPIELVFLSELFHALAAHVFLHFEVHCFNVATQAVFRRKVLVTICARKLVLFFVHVFYVSTKREFGAEVLCAMITEKVFDLFVNGLDVVLEVAVLGEAAGADVAYEKFAVLFSECSQVHDAVASQGPTI